ncbi:MAG: hypothetical protein DRG37_06445 [Deltaproteobacteria bacterium]|nr:MAG: hypothetical protein DRG37_06445 [Deltaproteobacteria bacterium]
MTYTIPSGGDIGTMFVNTNLELNFILAYAFIIIIFFMAFKLIAKKERTENAFVGASFFAMIISFMFISINAILPDYGLIPMIVFAVSSFFAYSTRDRQ